VFPKVLKLSFEVGECKPLGDGTVRVWDVGGGRVVAKLEGYRPVTSCARNPEGVSADMALFVWDGGDAREVARVEGQGLTLVHFSAQLERFL